MVSILQITFYFLLFTTVYANRFRPDATRTTTTISLRNSYQGADGQFPANIQWKFIFGPPQDQQVHVVPFDQTYSFDINFDSTNETVVQCHITARNSDGVFNIYNSTRDITRCPHTCNWIIARTAILGFPETTTNPDMFFYW